MTDSSSPPNVVWQARYKAFGEAQVDTSSTITNNFRFPGQYYNAETGLHYNYHRYYDPNTGRYVSADPIGLQGGINLFVYVENNPINSLDQYGLSQAEEITKGAYRFVKYIKNEMHGGVHWHVYSRRCGNLLGRLSPAGEVLTGFVPKSAIKILVKLGKIGGGVVGVVLELALPDDAGAKEDMLPQDYTGGTCQLPPNDSCR